MMSTFSDRNGTARPRGRRFLSLLAVAVMAFAAVPFAASGWNDGDAPPPDAGTYARGADAPFIDWRYQINTDVSSLSATNWMSGISGERLLTEINLPGTHDSCTKVVTGGISILRSFANTQIRYIDEQLEDGIRWLDIRLTELDDDGEDDGVNLYLCHGKTIAGAYYGLDRNGELITLAKVLKWSKDFLAEHPTETIILDMTPEISEGKTDRINKVYARLRGALEDFSHEINP